MLYKEVRVGSIQLTLDKGKLGFLFKCKKVTHDNKSTNRDIPLFIRDLLKLLKRLKPKVNEGASRTIISIPIGSGVTLEIVCCTLTDTILSIGLCDTLLKTNVSILLIEGTVESIDLSDGYVNNIKHHPSDELTTSSFIELICEMVSCCSPMESTDTKINVGLDNYNPIL